MTCICRRGALSKIAGFGVGAAVLGTSAPLLAIAPIPFPTTPMRLARTLTRDLGESASLSVERHWIVRFSQQGRGIVLTGEQTFAKVKAPTNLAPIAQIEEQRSTADMWPILLSPGGMIVGAGEYTRQADVKNAVKAAQSLISASPETAGSAATHALYLGHLQRAAGGLIDQLPSDLFFPNDEKPRFVHETINLPEGQEGELSVSYTAAKSEEGWLQSAQRSVLTRVGGTARRASEAWTMTAI